MLAAIAATVRHRLVIFALNHVEASTVTARGFIAPAVSLKILASSFLIRELLEKLIEANCLWLVLLAAHEL
jgi:hypothetical protein